MKKVAATLALLLVSFPAYAHRGAESVVQEEHPGTGISKIPGFFDAGVVPKGRFVLEVPTATLDFGLTENLTVGTGLWHPLVTVLSSAKLITGHAKARYRFFSNRTFALAGTAYLGAVWVPGGVEVQGLDISSMTATYQAGTINLSYSVGSSTELLFHVGGIRGVLSAADQAIRYSERIDFNLLMAGPGVQHFFKETFGFDAIVPIPFLGQINVDSSQISASSAVFTPGSLIPLRVMMHFKTGQESFVSFGATAVYFQKTLYRLPLFTWAWVL